MKRIAQPLLVLSILLLVHHFAFAQFSNDFEKNAFAAVEANSPSSYDLLHAVNYNKALYDKGQQEIDAHIAALKAKKIDKKPLKKQIQTIYKSTHSRFLKKYEEEAYFNQIFENGNYNCVSASALYAIVFDQFEINYAIKETPTHVYLIADTNGLQTMIETTTPGTGVVPFNDAYKKESVDYMYANKMISEEEYSNTSTDALFKKLFLTDQSIDLNELAALQYYNKAIFLMGDEKYMGGADYLRKAALIYPSNGIVYNRHIALQNAA